VAPGQFKQASLNRGDALDRDLDAQVAAGHHDPSERCADDRLGVLGCLRLLDLRDQRDVGACDPDPPLHRLQVLRSPDERDGEQVEPPPSPRSRPSPGPCG